jgi:outer membrane receptor protein involved in Fe transport
VISNREKVFRPKKLSNILALSAISGFPIAGHTNQLEEVVVTATKRSASLQSVPVTVTALTEGFLRENNITSFEDYVATVPTLSRSGVAPGRSQLYIRGISTGGPQFESAAAGPEPSAGIYLDEQPITTLGANLDVHVYDVARIEVLSGPQGTLFGAGSQSGALRIITNKPDLSGFDAGFDVLGSYTEEGEFNNSVEAFVNIPVSKAVALRGVFYNVHEAGYIDAIPGVQRSPVDNGFGFGEVIGEVVDGPDPRFVEDNQNEVTKTGFRVAALIEHSDSLRSTVSVMHQKLQIDGVFQHDPEENGDLNIVNLYPNEREDTFTQAGLTVEGSVGELEMLYAGSFLDREVDDIKDFTDYSEVGAYQDFYTCDYYAIFYFQTGTVEDDCQSQVYGFRSEGKYERQTHEFRVTTPETGRLYGALGLFYQDDKADLDLEFLYPNGADPGIENGLFGLPGSPVLPDRDPSVGFVNRLIREKEQYALFGEVNYDIIPEQLTATFGVRYYDITQSFDGFNIGFALPFRDLSGFPDLEEDGEVLKATVSWTPDEDYLFYLTYSEGFRPGGFNRTPGPQRDPNIPVPANFKADVLDNYEFGWKTELFGNLLRLNGAFYYMKRSDTQVILFDAAVSGASFAVNGPESETVGMEVDFSAALTDALNLYGGFSYNESEISDDFVNLSGGVLADEGASLPYAPEFQGNVGFRYNWAISGGDMFLRGLVRHTGSSVNSLVAANATKQDSYTVGDLGVGAQLSRWRAELYVSNLWDERAELFIDDEFLGGRITTNRPRTLGVRFSYRMN